MNFLVYIDKGGSPQLLELKNENGTVVEKVVKTYSSRNSVGVSETQEVFAVVFSNTQYQADSYGLEKKARKKLCMHSVLLPLSMTR